MKFLPLDGYSWEDVRGWGVRALEASGVAPGGVGEMHVASLEPGAVRGNHVHPNVTEWIIVFGGPTTLAWRPRDGAVERIQLPGPGPTLVELAPGEAHAVRCDGEHTAFLASWADGVPETIRGIGLL